MRIRGVSGLVLISFFILWMAVSLAGAQEKVPEVNVITDRTPSYLEPVVEKYEAKNKVKINITYVDEGLVTRLKAKPDEADIIISKTAEDLEKAKREGLLSPFQSAEMEKNIEAPYRDKDNYYIQLTYRTRAIFYSKERVKPSELSTYEALADPKWKGRVCIRSGYHNYNLNLFGQMMSTMGYDGTKKLLIGLKENLARKPIGNDRGQAQAIYEGKCDVALVNSYYMGLMLDNAEQKPWAESCELFFPNQEEGGAYILTCGAALTTAQANKREATKFLEFLTSVFVQSHFAGNTHEYPFNKETAIPPLLKTFGKDQAQVKEGVFLIKRVSLPEITDNREAVIKLLDEIGFDK